MFAYNHTVFDIVTYCPSIRGTAILTHIMDYASAHSGHELPMHSALLCAWVHG